MVPHLPSTPGLSLVLTRADPVPTASFCELMCGGPVVFRRPCCRSIFHQHLNSRLIKFFSSLPSIQTLPNH